MAQLSETIVDRTLDRLYSAATDPDAWPAALESISVAFDAPRVAIMRTTPQMDDVFELRQFSHDPPAGQEYRDDDWTLCPSLRLTRGAAAGEWLNVLHFLAPRAAPGTDAMGFAVPDGLRYVAGGKVCGDESSVTLLGLQRPVGLRPFDEDGALAFRRLAGHIGRAARLDRELRRADRIHGISIAALDSLDMPVFAVDGESRLTLCNHSGEEHLRSRSLLALCGGRVIGADHAISARLRAALEAAGAGCAEAFTVPAPTGRWLVRVVPLAHSPGTALLCLGHSLQSPIDTAALCQSFGFSDAEADIARQLVAGVRPKVIAAHRHVAESTVRTQVRLVFQKAGVQGVAALGNVLSAFPRVRDPDTTEASMERHH